MIPLRLGGVVPVPRVNGSGRSPEPAGLRRIASRLGRLNRVRTPYAPEHAPRRTPMSAERPTLPPVRLHSEAELARDALAAPLFVRAVRLARWAGPDARVGAGGELVEAQLPAAAEHLGLSADDDGAAYASEAWRLAVDTGLLDVTDPEEGSSRTAGRARVRAPSPRARTWSCSPPAPRRTSWGSGWRASTPCTPTPPRPSWTISRISSARTARSTSTPWTGTRRPRRSSSTASSATSICSPSPTARARGRCRCPPSPRR